MGPKVAIVLLNWNGYEISRECLESLAPITYRNHEILFVDNASADGSGPRIQREFPTIVYIQNDSNLGFARGCNVGVRRALERGADYVLLLNNDCTVEPGFLEPLVAQAESDPKIGLVSGKIYLGKDRQALWYAGAHVSRLMGRVVVHNHLTADRGDFDRTEEVRACTGAMMLIRRSVLESVGPLPEEYFFGQEEWDYSLTVHRAGYKLYYVPASVIYHRANGSYDSKKPMYYYCGHRNKLIFQSKFFPRALLPMWTAVYWLYVELVAPLRLRIGPREMHAFKVSLRAALRDHYRAGRLYVEESDLLEFERDYRRRYGPGPGPTVSGSDARPPASS
jgi:GT2 family glycosyltransferase